MFGQKFLNLVKKHFPKGHPLNKIFNSNTVKVTYSCLPNMGVRIAGCNKSKLNEDKPKEEVNKCTCKKEECPVNKECRVKDTIYEAVMIDSNQNRFRYIGKSSTEFIVRYRNHKKDIKNKVYEKSCELSKKAWELKEAGMEYKLEWKLRKLSKSYQPGEPFCRLCLEEINQIIFYNENEKLLNSKNELYKKCRHKSRFKLGVGESD